MTRASLLIYLLLLFFSAASQELEEEVISNHNDIKTPGLDTKLSVSYRGVSFQNVIEDLEDRYGFNFSYINEKIPLTRKVYFVSREISLQDLLDNILKNIPVGYSVIGNNIVLINKEVGLQLEERKSETSEDSITLYKLGRGQTGEFRKISLLDFLSGDWEISYPYLEVSEDMKADTLSQSESALDSIKVYRKKLRRIRIKYIKSREFRPKNALIFSVQPELASWTLTSNLKSSVDIGRYNDYKYPDPGFTASIGYYYRFFKGFYVQPIVGFTNLSRKGVHIDYLVDFFSPNIAHPVRSNFSSNYNLFNSALESGYELKFRKMKVAIAVQGFISIMLWKAAPEYFPYYETKYYIFGPPYYNSKYERLRQERIFYRKTHPGLTGCFKVDYIMSEKIDLSLGIFYRYYYRSLYQVQSSITEKARVQGLIIGVRYNW